MYTNYMLHHCTSYNIIIIILATVDGQGRNRLSWHASPMPGQRAQLTSMVGSVKIAFSA